VLNFQVSNAFILTGFVFFLREYLIFSTIILVILGVIFLLVSFNPGKWIRNGMSLILLISYWYSFKKVFDPEVGLNFLTSVTVLKILERESIRDQYMIFYGLVLLISAGSLFEKNIFYVGYFLISFYFLLTNFYSLHEIQIKKKDSFKVLMWIAPLVMILFFLFPRAFSPIAFSPRQFEDGEIGYNPDVKISQFSKLVPNDQLAFQAETDELSFSDKLYWRGNSISYSDGWDWSHGPLDQEYGELVKTINPSGIKQKIKLNFNSKFLFGLESPVLVKTSSFQREMNVSGNLSNDFSKKISRYEIFSLKRDLTKFPKNSKFLTRTSLNPREKSWINERFTFRNDPTKLVREIREYFLKNKFSYSLSPGEMNSFFNFVAEKKVGVCTHYSSALALILRYFKIPTRLVSGFLGGEYNSYGGYYQINQNDAHVWVEYFHEGKWHLVDPTLWVAPSRLDLPTDVFLTSLESSGRSFFPALPFEGAIKEIRMWMTQWDFKFYTWLEATDYFYQEEILTQLGLKRIWLYVLIPGVLLLFFFPLLFMIKRKKSLESIVWFKFLKILGLNDPKNYPNSIHDMKMQIQKIGHPKTDNLLEILQDLEQFSFNDRGDLKSISKKLSKI